MVDKLVKETLESLGVPVSRLLCKGNANTFITFQLVLGARTKFYDDECEGKEYVYRADIYSRSDYTQLLAKAETALETLECYEIKIDPEYFESDTGYYHVPITFKIFIEN